jgi:hypothetical protein
MARVRFSQIAAQQPGEAIYLARKLTALSCAHNAGAEVGFAPLARGKAALISLRIVDTYLGSGSIYVGLECRETACW